MAEYRKKPVVIEAVQFTTTEARKEGGAFAFSQANGIGYFEDGLGGWPEVHTLEGTMRMEPGDWLITGIKGEKYPCKPDIFAATYEPVGYEEGGRK